MISWCICPNFLGFSSSFSRADVAAMKTQLAVASGFRIGSAQLQDWLNPAPGLAQPSSIAVHFLLLLTLWKKPTVVSFQHGGAGGAICTYISELLHNEGGFLKIWKRCRRKMSSFRYSWHFSTQIGIQRVNGRNRRDVWESGLQMIDRCWWCFLVSAKGLKVRSIWTF